MCQVEGQANEIGITLSGDGTMIFPVALAGRRTIYIQANRREYARNCVLRRAGVKRVREGHFYTVECLVDSFGKAEPIAAELWSN